MYETVRVLGRRSLADVAVARWCTAYAKHNGGYGERGQLAWGKATTPNRDTQKLTTRRTYRSTRYSSWPDAACTRTHTDGGLARLERPSRTLRENGNAHARAPAPARTHTHTYSHTPTRRHTHTGAKTREPALPHKHPHAHIRPNKAERTRTRHILCTCIYTV